MPCSCLATQKETGSLVIPIPKLAQQQPCLGAGATVSDSFRGNHEDQREVSPLERCAG